MIRKWLRHGDATPTLSLPAALDRPFRAIFFDWDGTAVVDRKEDAAAFAHEAEDLLRQGVWLAVVTGTNFGNINRQLGQIVAPALRHHLLICTNRGSEVYGFDSTGQAVRRYLRVATPDEEQKLDAVTAEVARQLRETYGLTVQVVADRLNRRKVDLIPEPAWADPPKARIGELLRAVEARLAAAQVPGGLHGVIQLGEQVAAAQGLSARVTSDVKNLEIGLTDKADAVAWLHRELLQPAGIPWHDVLIGGDEFGDIAGFPGSDSRLCSASGDAPVVSVGVEPNGVPPGVIALGGGPARFRDLFGRQVQLHAQKHTPTEQSWQAQREALALALATTPDPQWSLLFAGADPTTEEAAESRLTIANGLLAARGALEVPAPQSLPRALVAGLFAPTQDDQHLPVLVSAPNWSRLRITVDGVAVTLDNAQCHRTLDMARGTLLSQWQCTTATGITLTLRALRAASQDTRALAWHAARLDVSAPATIVVESWLEPLDPLLIADAPAGDLLRWHTSDGRHTLALATHAQLDLPSGPLAPTPTNDPAVLRWEWAAQPDHPALYSRLLAAGRDALDAPVAATFAAAQARGFGALIEAHERAWGARWAQSDMVLGGTLPTQIDLRFAVYHLISAANPDDPAVSIGARALTGEAYHGHVFWDTEIFLLPFYTLTWPAAARALLTYRHHTLAGARAKASQMGYRGALYAWESTDTGAEVTPETVVDPLGKTVQVLSGRQEQHISADIAYAVWHYWTATGDADFLLDYGAEIILETARFWASRATHEADGHYHIRGVIGPDEYHENVDDNAFTNGMARWNLRCGLDIVRTLAERWPARWDALRTQLALAPAELAAWPTIAAGIILRQDPQTKVIEQFQGFFDLDPLDLRDYADRQVPIDVVLGHDRTQRTQVVKQADVIMLLFLLWDEFDAATITANFLYYEPRTAHGSSLDPAIHALVAARVGNAELAQHYLQQTVAVDGEDSTHSEAMGLHIATLGGLWQATVFGFGGITISADGIAVNPHLPAIWPTLSIPLRWHESHLLLTIAREPRTITVAVQGGGTTLTLAEQAFTLAADSTSQFHWDDTTKQWLLSANFAVIGRAGG